MKFERLPLLCLPTPCHCLDRLSEQLGAEIWIKRDDLTGYAGGGNKGRKLEYLMPSLLASGCDTVLTSGAMQSNFVRHLAVACAQLHLAAHAVLMPNPYEPGREAVGTVATVGGNRVLADLVGLTVHEVANGTWDELERETELVRAELEAKGARVEVVPLGGSSVAGAYGFYQAAQELPRAFDWVICPTSSGSTHAGLAAAFAESTTQVWGIAADPEPELADVVLELAQALEPGLKPEDIRLSTEFVGPGYGVPSEAGQDALSLLARMEGIFLDPIYSSKAFAGLLELVRRGEIGGSICFWHTGGFPGLFATPGTEGVG